MLNLTPFQDIDWDCYAGCEDKNPLIADDVITIDLNGCGYVGQVIVDGFFVVIHIDLASYLENDDISSIKDHPVLNQEMSIISEHMTREFAVNMAKSIPDKPTAEWLFLNGFKLS
jgi:hypothetical protein